MYNYIELFGIPTRLVMDPVHGGIPFFDHESKMTDHFLFQRLRHIAQMDVGSLVFPGATHSRFIHSIGAMHIASRIYKTIIHSILKADKTNNDSVPKEVIESIQYFHYCIRLAALFHDCGHLPFSHQFEHLKEVQGILNEESEETFKALWKDKDYKQYYKSVPKVIKHEHYSVRFADEILNTTNSDLMSVIKSVDVICLMETTDCEVSDKFKEHMGKVITFIKGINDSFKNSKISEDVNSVINTMRDVLRSLISGELDVDKMDYLLRDSYFSGVTYGVYNLDYLVNNIRIGFNDEWIGIAIPKKSIGALEDFVYSRFRSYLELYNHKVVVGFRFLLEKAIGEVLSSDKTFKLKDIMTDINKLKDFTDAFFWERIRTIAASYPNSACSYLLKREKMDYLESVKRGTKAKKKEIFGKWKKERPNDNIVQVNSRATFSKINEVYEVIRVQTTKTDKNENSDKNGAMSFTNEYEDISEITSFFEKFKEENVVHFFVCPTIQMTCTNSVGTPEQKEKQGSKQSSPKISKA